jgi:hypothetical protein
MCLEIYPFLLGIPIYLTVSSKVFSNDHLCLGKYYLL